MRGCIVRRGRASWRLKYDVGADDQGKRIIRYETIRGTKRKAEDALACRLNEIAEGRYVPPTMETLGTYARHWLVSIAPVDRSPLTLARYRTLINVHIIPGIGDVPLKDVTGKTIDAFYAHCRSEGKRYGGGLSSSTMGILHRLLALLLKSAVKARLIAASPIQDCKPSRSRSARIL